MNNPRTTPASERSIHGSPEGRAFYAFAFVCVIGAWVIYGFGLGGIKTGFGVYGLVGASLLILAVAWLALTAITLKRRAENQKTAIEQLMPIVTDHNRTLLAHPLLEQLIYELCNVWMRADQRTPDGQIPAPEFVDFRNRYVVRHEGLDKIAKQFVMAGTLPGVDHIEDDSVRTALEVKISEASRSLAASIN